jgi:hypothetical protein
MEVNSAHTLVSPIEEEASEGTSGEPPRSRKSCRALPRPARKRGRDCRLVPKPAACRQARGRRRPDDREVVRRLPRTKAFGPGSWTISTPSAGGFPTALGQESPKKVFLRRVLVSETSVVETDSKHRGGASEESREASRGAHRRATGSREARTGPIVIHFAQRCQGLRCAERRRASHSMDAACEQSALRSSLGGRSPGSRLDPWKARGVSIPGGAKHASRDARSRLRDEARRCGDRQAAPRGDITRPRHCLFVGSPSRWAQGAG